jgi:ribonuclease HII
MAIRCSKLSVEEIRKRFVDNAEPVSAGVLRELNGDPRSGVQRIYRLLKQRQEAERAERSRVESLLNFERLLWSTGLQRIAGVDEAGVGPLAGPVVAAAVVFPIGVNLKGIDDSKKLDPDQREDLARKIHAAAHGVGIGVGTVEEIDALNIYQASLLAMRRAVEALPTAPQHVLIDARRIPDLPFPQTSFHRGDGINFSIAAASIIAKTHRDRLMNDLDAQYPEYGLARHKGYPTPEHCEAIRRHGPSEIHRMSFPVLRELCGECSPLFYELRRQLAVADRGLFLEQTEERLESSRAELNEMEQRRLRTMLARRWKTLDRQSAQSANR